MTPRRAKFACFPPVVTAYLQSLYVSLALALYCCYPTACMTGDLGGVSSDLHALKRLLSGTRTPPERRRNVVAMRWTVIPLGLARRPYRLTRTSVALEDGLHLVVVLRGMTCPYQRFPWAHGTSSPGRFALAHNTRKRRDISSPRLHKYCHITHQIVSYILSVRQPSTVPYIPHAAG
ncbi:hypothetical protein K466DRAFT_220636 [Polyporus arcularius HHB13444]|uniref:Uncharacterized protein n=1 Tax=Polyporus arcularius HHB13444 TaxID=1314778 RepID=A0A5C3P517_9APHY|nr:hypothetical protein K466DRAFT_220636 [Polyporus arcularius HHB13444]